MSSSVDNKRYRQWRTVCDLFFVFTTNPIPQPNKRANECLCFVSFVCLPGANQKREQWPFCRVSSFQTTFITDLRSDGPKKINHSSKVGSYPGGGTSIYKLYRYVPHFRVWFSSRFSLK